MAQQPRPSRHLRADEGRAIAGLGGRLRSLAAHALSLALVGLCISPALADDTRRPGAPGGINRPARPDVRDRDARKDHLDRVTGGGGTTPSTMPTGERPIPPTVRRDGALVGRHHGSVRIIADLARVEVDLSISNPTTTVLEWRETYALDPEAEVIGAVLHRDGNPATDAQTLELAMARQIYEEVRQSYTPPRPTPRPTRPRDPLRLERLTPDRLGISLFPVMPRETVRISLTFVTPLRGNGVHRVYEDVLGGADGSTRLRRSPAPTTPGPSIRERGDAAVWDIQATGLVLDQVPTGMNLEEENADGRIRLSGRVSAEPGAGRASFPFMVAKPIERALFVKTGSLGTGTAVWRFDPVAWLRSHGHEHNTGVTFEILSDSKQTSWIAPNRFHIADEARPVSARVARGARKVELEIVAKEVETGKVIVRAPLAIKIDRPKLDRAAEGAISGYHRAQLVRRVQDWAQFDPKLQAQAIRYGVEAGVLVAGTAALAIPPSDLRRISSASRRRYRESGAPLGAQRREAAWVSPPRAAVQR